MTSLHVICGFGPPIKYPGYAYARSWSRSGAALFYQLRSRSWSNFKICPAPTPCSKTELLRRILSISSQFFPLYNYYLPLESYFSDSRFRSYSGHWIFDNRLRSLKRIFLFLVECRRYSNKSLSQDHDSIQFADYYTIMTSFRYLKSVCEVIILIICLNICPDVNIGWLVYL